VQGQLPEIVGAATITVVDNGSTDGSVEAIAGRYPSVKVLTLRQNRGFTGGLQAAVSESSADHVIFLNNDAVPERDWFTALVRAIESAPPDVVSVAGKIIDLDGTRIDFIGGVLTFDGHAFQEGFRMPLGSRPEPAAGAELLFPCGGNMISRRELLVDLGGFDDDYFAYLEDVDFGWRAWIAGYRVLYQPDAVVRHASSATSDRIGPFERGVLFERNAMQTVIKNYEEQLLRHAGGAIFFAYLHRLHHYTTTRNRNVAELRRPAFGDAAVSTERSSFWARLKARLRGMKALATIDDPLTTMQFRAFEWILQNEHHLIAKREAVQRRRRRSDREIFEKFPLHFVPTYPGDERLLRSALFRALKPSVPSVERELSDIMRR
jgi:GT2 family glycosyltransferase